MGRLPGHVAPMLARIGSPFDSPEHLFEIKWDGVRAVTYVEDGRYRMHGRKRRDLADRYPELAPLASLPSGTVLDGELVVLRSDGRPDFRAIIGRENGNAARAQDAARLSPVVYIAFDLLYEHGENVMPLPLSERRERLAQLVAAAGMPRLVLSDGVAGDGLALFAAARDRGLEGVVGKRLESPYLPGERTDAWQKIKVAQQVHCLILGYEPDGERGFKSLIIATDFGDGLRCVGRVGSGIGDAERAQLERLLAARAATSPLIDAGMPGRWIEPGLYCTVSYLELTDNGSLRAPVFMALAEDAR